MGHQSLVDKATVYLTSQDVADTDDAQRVWQKLAVKSPDCYGQIDLYGDDVTYDGGTGEEHGSAPYEPDGVVTPYHLIAAWNGGGKPCAPSTPEKPTPTPSQPAPSSPATPTTPAGGQPPTGMTTPPTTPKPSMTLSTTPDVPPLVSTPPTTPKPTPSDSTPPLAETGSNAPVGLIAGGAALVVARGAGATGGGCALDEGLLVRRSGRTSDRHFGRVPFTVRRRGPITSSWSAQALLTRSDCDIAYMGGSPTTR